MTKKFSQDLMHPAEFSKRAAEIAVMRDADSRRTLTIAIMVECLYRNGFGVGVDVLGVGMGAEVEQIRRGEQR